MTAPPTQTIQVGDVSFAMVSVSSYTFWMGAAEDDDASDSEKPRHEVHLSSYQIGQTQVTQGLYKAVRERTRQRTQLQTSTLWSK